MIFVLIKLALEIYEETRADKENEKNSIKIPEDYDK